MTNRFEALSPENLSEVNCAYVGIPNRCMCGCSGEYAYTSQNHNLSGVKRGYEVSDDEVSDRKVRGRIKKMQDAVRKGASLENIEDYIFTVYIGSRQYTLYLFEKPAETR